LEQVEVKRIEWEDRGSKNSIRVSGCSHSQEATEKGRGGVRIGGDRDGDKHCGCSLADSKKWGEELTRGGGIFGTGNTTPPSNKWRS